MGIPAVVDRLNQQALLQAQEYARQGYRWVVDPDLEKLFDRANHDMLTARNARKVTDKRVLRTIRRSLQVGVMEQGLVSPRREGTPATRVSTSVVNELGIG